MQDPFRASILARQAPPVSDRPSLLDERAIEQMRDVAASIMRAVGVHPPQPTRRSRRATALHEAGHAVLGQVEGFAPFSVAIWPDDPGEWSGACWFGAQCRITDNSHPAYDLKYARVILAGPLAVELFDTAGPHEPHREFSAFEAAHHFVAAKCGRLDDREWILDQLTRNLEYTINTLRASEGRVSAVANALMQREAVEFKQLRRLLVKQTP